MGNNVDQEESWARLDEDSLDGIEEIHMHVGMYMHTHMHCINSH